MTLPFDLGALPAWVPVWAVPAAILHIALFIALVIPAWVGLARARAGGPLALLLILPVLGLLMLTPIYMNRVLPYAHWGRFWGLLILIPGLNIFFLWIFAFAPWKRRYIPLDQEEYSEPQSGLAPRSVPRLDARTASRAATHAPHAAGASEDHTMVRGAPAPGPGTFSPRSVDPGTMMAGGEAPPQLRGGRTAEPGTMIAGALDPQPMAEPPPPPPPSAPRGPRTAPPPAYAPPDREEPRYAPPAYEPPAPVPPSFDPPRPSAAAPRTLDVAAPRPPLASEPATVRMAPGLQQGGRVWRLVGANDVAAAIDFTVDEASLRASENGILVGRSTRAQLVVDHESVSRNHARFLIDRGALCIEDLDSMNGTWVDGQKLEPNEPAALQPNGIVEIGKVALRVTGG